MLANATDITIWANSRDSQDTLPRLVRRLIHGTLPRVLRVGFPAGEGVQMGGWDGIVEVQAGNAFVPEGTSAWELGANKDVKGKADADYEKRTAAPLGIEPSESTFVFVTPRRWANKSQWVSERKKEEKWSDVRAYDADDLEEWLETAPSIRIWFSIHLGKHPEGATDCDSYWQDWASATGPTVSPDLVLAGRGCTMETIHCWIVDPSKPLILRGESRAEAGAAFSAAIQRLDPDRRIEVLSRAVMVRDGAAWNRLAAANDPLILVQDFESAEAVGRALRHKHGVVVLLGHADVPSADAIEIPRISNHEAASALAAMGVAPEKVGEFATLARRSLTALRRRISIVREVEQPKWARPDSARSLLAALFAGRWSGAVDGDREALAELAGTRYDDVSACHVRWSNEDDPPLRCVGDAWYLASEEDAWLLLARYVTRDDLERFEQVVVGVLGSPDPAFDLEQGRRWMARVLGHKPPHSGLLRTGLANTLAILGARAEFLTTTEDVSLSGCATACVRRLLETNDWKVLASLPLPLLAEAAPDEFLAALDRGLVGDQPTLAGLFRGENDDMFSSPLHIDLLWALEQLAWSEDYLVRATSSLGKLAMLDPGGKWANRPDRSLRTIFLPWLPRTTASLERRLAAIDNLRRLVPEVAWKLLNALLPREMDHQNPTAKPRWRDWAPEEDVRITGIEYARTVQELVARMIEDAGTNGGRWGDFLAAVPQLPRAEYDAVVAKLEALDPEEMQPNDSALLWNVLRSLISQHRSHPDAKWSLPKAEVDRFAALLARFEPKEPLQRFGWLFGSRVALPEGREDDWEEYQRAVTSRQCRAVEILHDQIGLNWLPDFIEKVEQPRLLGAAVARSGIGKRVEDDLLREYLRPEDARCHDLVAGLIGEQVGLVGLEWAQQKLTALGQKWSPAQRAAFCVCLPFTSTTWELVHGLDKETVREYWKTVSPFYVDETDVENATRELLARDRPYVAVGLLQHYVRGKDLSPALVLDALEQLVRTSPAEKDQRRLSPHDLSDLLAFVSGAADVEETRIAALEWAMLPALGRHQYTPKLLHRELSRSPKFFAQVVGLVYRSEGEEPREQSEEEQALWTRAYELLQSWRWRPLPGMPENGDIEPEAIRRWVSEAREILRGDGRLAVGDQMIGQILSRSPAGDDGVWPHSYLRDLIEEIESDDFEQGIFLGLLNSQGVTSRSLNEGGTRERKEAEKYEGWARAVSCQWGRTAAMLRRLRDHYRARAKDEDQRAELREDLSE